MPDPTFSLARFYSILRHGGFSLASQSINSATNFLTGIMLGRLCSKEEYGLYALGFSLIILFPGSSDKKPVASVQGSLRAPAGCAAIAYKRRDRHASLAMTWAYRWIRVFTEFQTALISMPYMIFSPRLIGNDKNQYAGSTLIHQIIFSFLISAFLLAGLIILSLYSDRSDLVDVIKILVIFITFIMLKDFIRQLCFSSLMMRTAFIIDMSVALIQISGLLFLLFWDALSSNRAFIIIGIACGLTSIFWLMLNRRHFLPKLSKALPDFLHNWKLAKWIIASNIVWTLAMNLYPLFITAFHGVAANGIYAACIVATGVGNLVLLGAQNFLGPKIVHVYAQDGKSGMYDFILRSMIFFLIVMSGVCLFLMLFGDSIVILFYGDKYAGNGLLVSILALNLLVSSTSFTFSRGLFAMERADIEFLVNVTGIAVLLVFGISLVRTYGLHGAAYGLLITNALSSVHPETVTV